MRESRGLKRGHDGCFGWYKRTMGESLRFVFTLICQPKHRFLKWHDYRFKQKKHLCQAMETFHHFQRIFYVIEETKAENQIKRGLMTV